MSSAGAPRTKAGTAAPVASELCVFVRCRGFLCSFAVAEVDRLLMLDEVNVRGAIGGPVPALAEVAGAPCAAWDFAALLGVTHPPSAWILIQFPMGKRIIPIALRTGECVYVRDVSQRSKLPQALFTARPGAIASAFAAPAQKAKDATSELVALQISVKNLLTRTELDAAATLMDRNAPRRAAP